MVSMKLLNKTYKFIYKFLDYYLHNKNQFLYFNQSIKLSKIIMENNKELNHYHI